MIRHKENSNAEKTSIRRGAGRRKNTKGRRTYYQTRKSLYTAQDLVRK
jgi:hypothetical protein